MHAKNLIIDESSDWHAIKHVLEFFPNPNTVASFTFVIEAVHAIDLTALVVTSQQEEILRVLHFVGEQKNDSLKGLSTSVNIITKEKVVCLRWEASILKKSKKIWELSMRIT